MVAFDKHCNSTFQSLAGLSDLVGWTTRIAMKPMLIGWMACIGLANPSLAQYNPVAAPQNSSPNQSPEILATSLEIEFEKLEGTTSAPVITALAGSRDGKFVAAAGDDHAIRIVDSGSGKTLQTVIGHTDWIQSLLFVYPDGRAEAERVQTLPTESTEFETPELYSAGHDGRVLRWKFTTPLEAQEVAIVPYAVRSISISTERHLLAIGGFSDEVLLYDLAQEKYVRRLKCASADQRCVRFSPDGSRILSGSREGEIIVWETATGNELARYHHHQSRIHTAAFSKDGNWITSAGEDRRVIRYDLTNRQIAWSHELALSKMMSLCLINDYLTAVAGADNRIRLFDVQSNAIVAEMSGHAGTVRVMAPCGEGLLSGSFDTTVRLWNLDEMEQERIQKDIPTSRTPIKLDKQLQIR